MAEKSFRIQFLVLNLLVLSLADTEADELKAQDPQILTAPTSALHGPIGYREGAEPPPPPPPPPPRPPPDNGGGGGNGGSGGQGGGEDKRETGEGSGSNRPGGVPNPNQPRRPQKDSPVAPGIPSHILDKYLNKHKGHKETFYEPYWHAGHWVFDRMLSTRKPKYQYLYTGFKEHRECSQICPIVYQDYGKVCGHRLSNYYWRYEFKEFDSMCFLEAENCKSKKRRPSKYLKISKPSS